MSAFGNVIWLVLYLGWLNALVTFISGTILVFTGIGAPIGLGLIQYSKFLILPFSYEMARKKDITNQETSFLMKNLGRVVLILYIPFGLVIVFISIIQCVIAFITIIGIPAGLVLAKSLPTLLNPIEKICVEKTLVQVAKIKKAEKKYEELNKQ